MSAIHSRKQTPLCFALWGPELVPEIKAAFFFGLEHIPKTAVCTNIESALVEASQSFPDHDVVLLNMCGSQPKIFFPRMLGTWNAQLSLDVLSPLHLEQDSFSGLPAVNLDAITYQRSKHQLYMSKHAIDHGSFIRNTVISKLVINDHDSINAAKCDCVVVSSRENISSNGEQVAGSDNEKPSILHVLHSWGGGIDFFAKDLKKGDLDRNHFFLKSHSRDNAAPFGKELCLYHSLEEEPVAQWFLAEQIADTQIESNEVARILKSIIERWAIGAVLVSSLIGHSLDVLDTGLPTALAIHDVYPFWPLLHDSNLEDTSKEYLAEALESQRQDIIFQPHSAPYWLQIRDELIARIEKGNITCVSPSLFAKNRICRIETRLNNVSWRVIPHGIDSIFHPFDAGGVKIQNSLKVLVPGHINGRKGEVLLNELANFLSDGIELVLLGSAHLSEKFASEKITVIPHYCREKLTEIISEIQPDVALLPSMVPETYGYVLSEMLSVGLPVICSNIGAYAERGSNLPGVILVEPDAGHYLEALIMLRDNPDRVTALKHSLPFLFPRLDEMAQNWASALPASPPHWLFELNEDPTLENEAQMNLQLNHIAEVLQLVHASTEKNAVAIDSSIDSFTRQQAVIDGLLQTLNSQARQIEVLLAGQAKLESSISDKENKINALTGSIDEQAAAIKEQIEISQYQGNLQLHNIQKLAEDFSSKFSQAKIQGDAEREKQTLAAAALQAHVDKLSAELSTMQAKRGWRFLSMFR